MGMKSENIVGRANEEPHVDSPPKSNPPLPPFKVPDRLVLQFLGILSARNFLCCPP